MYSTFSPIEKRKRSDALLFCNSVPISETKNETVLVIAGLVLAVLPPSTSCIVAGYTQRVHPRAPIMWATIPIVYVQHTPTITAALLQSRESLSSFYRGNATI